MASIKQIKEYTVLHYRDGRTRINLYFTDGSWDFYSDLDASRASLLADLLRNEKPVYYSVDRQIVFVHRPERLGLHEFFTPPPVDPRVVRGGSYAILLVRRKVAGVLGNDVADSPVFLHKVGLRYTLNILSHDSVDSVEFE